MTHTAIKVFEKKPFQVDWNAYNYNGSKTDSVLLPHRTPFEPWNPPCINTTMI
jgi:hypothetical protein